MKRLLVLGVVAALAVATPAAAAPAPTTVVVAVDGSDAAAGTVGAPLRTVREALTRLPSGGTVELRGGTYAERIRITGRHDLTVRPYDAEPVVLSGAGLTPPSGLTAMVEIRDSDRITIRGLDITGYRTRRTASVPAGVVVTGHGDRIRLIGNHVHDLGNDDDTTGSFDINAHGIAVYGDDPAASIRRLEIRGNTVERLKLGASESVVVNGNVEHWSITHNRVRDNDNIGIDAIGFEETLPGKHRYTQRNRARDGVIAFNRVQRIASRDNPAYRNPDGSSCDCADGIYVDGGTRIRIHHNVVDANDIGIEVAAENRRGSASHVRVDHNRVTRSLFTGIATGGYCDGRADCGGERTGASIANRFDHNVLVGNNRKNDGSPEILIQYRTRGLRFDHNRVTPRNDDRVLYGTVDRGLAVGNRSDHNVFVGGEQVGWSGRTYATVAEYRRATGQDAHSSVR